MARSGINKALVQRARDALLARGAHPSIEAVRVELGNTGSKSTILRYLQELQTAEPHPPNVSLDEELHTLISSLAQRLAADAQAAVAADRARLQRQQAAYEQQRAIDQARFEQLKLAHDALSTERREAQQREQALYQHVQQLEGERQRLLAGEQHQLHLLEERARQIASLEDKHQHARDALSHYRQQHLAQREQELQRHDQVVQQLQLEARRLQEQLMSKQEELAQVYRDLERFTREQQSQALALRDKVTELQRLRTTLFETHSAWQAAEQHAQALHVEHSVLREKARRYVLDHRDDRRALRAQAKLLHDESQRVSTRTRDGGG
ncbi:DNA-binding protein [Pseudomonas sp. RC2C2]|uniref:DNA-binding protein n=1 Tax=Pseudomonas sp. RC2C2 TaxID=2834408 RepID=UPI001BCCCF30|nr:DNA-binding protein [Pseudomonas sp. RC2C2]MBS7596903.1 DNA-binding protein [Pseudomonas sp. RC2C2]